MAARVTQRPARYSDIEALPPNLVGEIVRGVLYASPRPASPHAAAASAVGEELADLGGWRRERMPVMPHVAAFELSPDWVCEVLSPDGGTYRILGTHFTDAKVRVEPFDAVELDLSILWAR